MLDETSVPSDHWTPREVRALRVFAAMATLGPWAGWFVLRWAGWDRWWSMILFVLAGGCCSLAGIGALAIQHGVSQLPHIVKEGLRPRGGALPWAMAALWGPVWMVSAYALYVAYLDRFVWPDWARLSAYGGTGALFLFLTGPLGEEFGWRGFLLPMLLKRWSLAKCNLLIGLAWAMWHWPLMLERWSADPLHLPYFIANVVVFSFMLSAVYLCGGLLPTILVHWSINASQEVVPAAFGLPGPPDKLLWLFISGTLVVLAMAGSSLLGRSQVRAR